MDWISIRWMGDKDPSDIKPLREIKVIFMWKIIMGDKYEIVRIRPRKMEKSIKRDAANGN